MSFKLPSHTNHSGIIGEMPHAEIPGLQKAESLLLFLMKK